MSLAVLVDQEVTWDQDKGGFKRVLVPPSAEKIKIIRELVSGITGFNAERGDQLVVETLPFETTLLLEPPPAPRQLRRRALRPAVWTPGSEARPADDVDRLEERRWAVLLLGVVALQLLRRKKKRNSVEVAAPAELAAPLERPPRRARLRPVRKHRGAARIEAGRACRARRET